MDNVKFYRAVLALMLQLDLSTAKAYKLVKDLPNFGINIPTESECSAYIKGWLDRKKSESHSE